MTEIRVDKLKLGKVSQTANGFLKGRAAATRTGVFEYCNLDGSTRFELRHPDDVLLPESLNTLKSLPITHDHPTELVNADNAAQLSVGMTGETIEVKENGHVMVSLSITHKDAIEAIKAGKQELSCGYIVKVIPEVGNYNGQPYTHRQTEIEYNHIAFVKQGRAGPDVRLNLDGAYIQCDEIKIKENMKINKDNEADALIEELTQTVSPEQKEPVELEAKKIEEDKPKIEKVAENTEALVEKSTNTDSLESIIEKQRAEIEKLKSVNLDSIIIEKTKQRAALLNKASAVVNIDSLVDKSDREIMETAIYAKTGVNLDLASKSDDYIAGRFDSVIEDLPSNVFKKQMSNLDSNVSAPKITSYRQALEIALGKING